METMEPMTRAEAPPTIEITTAPATLYAWPVEPAAEPTWRDRLANLFYRACTPTVEGMVLPNFGWLSPTLYRGAQPGRAGFRALKAMEVDTVINLRSESDGEAALVQSLGLNYLYFPLDPIAAPSHAQTLAFLHAVTDPRHGRVYFHCYHGADRTGVFAACFRIAVDGWSVDDALAELSAFGFHHLVQQAKWAYVKAFASYWHALAASERDRVLHQAPAA